MTTRLQPAFLCLATAAIGTLQMLTAQNIYPDPSFETAGPTGTARTGTHAGHLRVEHNEHWNAIGGRLAVEPFATYRATAYVKGKIGTGNVFALYCYEWNSYDWAFVRSVKLTSSVDWRKVQITFVSPYEQIQFHPLAYIDAANSDVWIDDVVVEKVMEPAETLAPLLAKPVLSQEERQFLARYYVRQRLVDKARALMDGASDYTKSDIACLLAQHAPEPESRRQDIIDMVRFGGPGYANGMTRFNEITSGLPPAGQLTVCSEALAAGGSTPSAAKAFTAVMSTAMRSTPAGAQTCAMSARHIAELRKSVGAALAACAANPAARKEVEKVASELDAMEAGLEERRRTLGRCTVTVGGKPLTPETHAIVTPDKPTPQEEHAAHDLQAHIEQITGHVIPVVAESHVTAETPIVIGRCQLLRKLGVDLDLDALGLEGIAIQTVGPALVLAGNRRGVLYACYTFLEDYLNCRWFTPDCTVLPKQGTFDVPPVKRLYIPPLEYRATDYPNSRDADWAVRNRVNGSQTRLDKRRGGKISYRGFVHTFNALVPPGTYFAEHPDYYSEINGRRVGPEHTQLCLTNPNVLRIATASVRRWIEESPEATIISVSQNDWHNYCQCTTCTELAEAEDSQAGPLLHFVNAIADAIGQEHPDKVIDTLAYQYTRKPPKHVRPHPNVAIRLCSIECCFVHPLETDIYNESFRADIEGWNAICNRLHIWDYVINYAHCVMPFPNLYVLKPNIDFFIRNGVTGIYEEANYFSKGGELAELRTWIMAKTLWDPTYDTDKAIDEFLAGYYQEAAQPIRDYINLVHAQISHLPDMHVRIYSPPSVGYLAPEVIKRSKDLFDDAERRVAAKPEILHRVRVARLPLLYSQLALSGSKYQLTADGLTPETTGGGLSGLVERFETIARAEGVTRIREGARGDIGDWLHHQKTRSKPLTFLKLRTPHLEAWLLPDAGGRIWRLLHVPTGRDVLKQFGDQQNGFQPTEGGYEEYSESGYRSPGWHEPYEVKAHSVSTVTLEGRLQNGLTLRRRVELDPSDAILRVESTVLNPGPGPRKACLRVHPAFVVGSTQTTTAWLRAKDGSWRKHSLAARDDPMKERELWLAEGACPDGAWAIVDAPAKLALTNAFKPEQVRLCYLNWSGKERRVNLELWSPEVSLDQGQSLTVRHEYVVASPIPAPFRDEAK